MNNTDTKDMTLLIMAAGMGSRYGGSKQTDGFGPDGEFLLDYSVFDAKRAGFNKVVFVIREEDRSLFDETIKKRAGEKIKIEYAFQKVTDVPEGVCIPEARKKPWGTAHAVWSARNNIREPFAVINADDFYGRDTFARMAKFLSATYEGNTPKAGCYCMVGYALKNTLTENGTVSRGVCGVKDGLLTSIEEHTRIARCGNDICDMDADNRIPTNVLDPDTVISMNCWGFTPDFFEVLDKGLDDFFKRNAQNLEKCEYYLLEPVQNKISANGASVTVLKTQAEWFGVTYKEDKENTEKKLGELIAAGEYPKKLWA